MTNVWKRAQKPEPIALQRPTTNQNTQFTYNIHVFCSYYSIYSTQKSYRFYCSHHLKSHNWQRWTCPGSRWHWLVNGYFVAIQQTGDAMRKSRALRTPQVSSRSNPANRSPSSDWTTYPFPSALLSFSYFLLFFFIVFSEKERRTARSQPSSHKIP